MLRPTCILLAVVTISSLPVICGESRSQSTMSGSSGGGNYNVQTSTTDINGKQVQRVTINGNGISDHFEFHRPSTRSLNVFNTDGTLIIGDPESGDLLIYSNTHGRLVVMKDGVCKEKTYHTTSAGTSSTSRQLCDSKCQEIKKRAEEELEKNRVYWDDWSKDFNKNMQDTFDRGFPFQNQGRNSGSSGNWFKGLADMHKGFFSGFFKNK